jgi:hypothetical protein
MDVKSAGTALTLPRTRRRSATFDRPDHNEDLHVWLDDVQRPNHIDRYIVVNQLHVDYDITPPGPVRAVAR